VNDEGQTKTVMKKLLNGVQAVAVKKLMGTDYNEQLINKVCAILKALSSCDYIEKL